LSRCRGGRGCVLPFAARCIGGSIAQGTAGAILRTEIVFLGRERPFPAFQLTSILL